MPLWAIQDASLQVADRQFHMFDLRDADAHFRPSCRYADLDIGANALLPYFVQACALVATSAGTTEAKKRLDAVARESTLHAAPVELGP